MSHLVGILFVLDREQVPRKVSCVSLSLQKPSRPLPIPTTRARLLLGPESESQPPVKNSDDRPGVNRACPFQGPEWSLSSGPGIKKGLDVAILGPRPPTVGRSGQNPALLVKRADETPAGVFSTVALTSTKSHGMGRGPHPRSLARCPDGSQEPCLHPTAPREGQDPKPGLGAPGKRQAQVPIRTCQNAPKKPRLGYSPTPRGSTGPKGLGAVSSLLALPDTSGMGLQGSPGETRKSPPCDPSMVLGPRKQSPVPKLVQPCTESSAPAAPSCVPRQPLTMVFRRLHGDCWSSGFLSEAPSPPLPKSNAPAESPRSPEGSAGHTSPMPVSVLYEDLQVSSSSEDSDLE